VLAAMALALQKTERIDEASELLEQVQIMITQGAELDPVTEDLVKRRARAAGLHRGAAAERAASRSRRTTIVVSSDLAASEIVSGEIGAGSAADQANIDNPTTSFKPAEPAPSIISSRSVDEQLTTAERKMLNIPDTRARREPTSNKPDSSRQRDQSLSGPNISFDESGSDAPKKSSEVPDIAIEETPPARSGSGPEVPSGPLVESLLTALFDEPEKPASSTTGAGTPGLINPAVSVPAVSTGLSASALPPEAPPPPPDKPEADVPVFRRRQTLTAIPVASDKSASAPTANPNSPFPLGGGTGALPTRTTRHEGNPIPGTVGAPRATTPVFKAPNLGKGEDDKR
jgi:hypothetical protein